MRAVISLLFQSTLLTYNTVAAMLQTFSNKV